MEANEKSQAASPRAAMQVVGGAMIAAAATAALASSAKAQGGTPTDADVLNFALNLEYLEAEFYLQAAFGRSLSMADSGGTTSATGARKVNFTNAASLQQAQEIAIDEENHVKFLRSALGSAAVARPTVDLSPAVWTAAAKAAGLIPATDTTTMFDPYANELFFLAGAFVFEDVGVTAYKGGARLIANKDFLSAAAGILAVEAYHAAEIRTLLYRNRTVTALGRTVEQIVAALSDLRDSVDGADDKDQGITLNGQANIVPTDANALAFSRTTSQVLRIVYLGGASSGGFFPQGLNGTIKTAT